ncbi:MAG: YiiX family permuted papain-like enzyme [Crocinitomicaceae bacterium]
MKYIFLLFITGIIACTNSEKPRKSKNQAETGKKEQVVIIDKRPRTGDLIFHTSKSNQSKAIQLATNSPYSHMGIIEVTHGNVFVYEAGITVRLDLFSDWTEKGVKGHYVIKRLKNADEILTEENIKKLRKAGEKYSTKHYDKYFEWSDDRMYCSELVWKIYKEGLGIEIGELQELQEFDLSAPIVQKIMKERYGEDLPLHEKVISPDAMFRSELLITVDSVIKQ